MKYTTRKCLQSWKLSGYGVLIRKDQDIKSLSTPITRTLSTLSHRKPSPDDRLVGGVTLAVWTSRLFIEQEQQWENQMPCRDDKIIRRGVRPHKHHQHSNLINMIFRIWKDGRNWKKEKPSLDLAPIQETTQNTQTDIIARIQQLQPQDSALSDKIIWLLQDIDQPRDSSTDSSSNWILASNRQHRLIQQPDLCPG